MLFFHVAKKVLMNNQHNKPENTLKAISVIHTLFTSLQVYLHVNKNSTEK